jgi:hypothetical protein
MISMEFTKVIDVELGSIAEISSGIYRELTIRTKDGDIRITLVADADESEIKILS